MNKKPLGYGLVFIALVVVASFVMDKMGIHTSADFVVVGIPVNVSLLFTIGLAIFALDGHYYVAKHYPQGSVAGYVLAAAVGAVVIIATIVLHEIGHAVATMAFGYHVEKAGISWWGAFVAPAESMLDMAWWQVCIIAIAGPAMNMLVAAVAYVLVKMFGESLLENTIQYIGYMNYRLGKLNMYPIIMLDGGLFVDGLLRSVVEDNYVRLALRVFIMTYVLVRIFRKRKEVNSVSAEKMFAEA